MYTSFIHDRAFLCALTDSSAFAEVLFGHHPWSRRGVQKRFKLGALLAANNEPLPPQPLEVHPPSAVPLERARVADDDQPATRARERYVEPEKKAR